MARQQKVARNTRFNLILPWWLFAVFAFLAFGLLHWVFPQTCGANPSLIMLVVLSRLLEWPVFIFFLMTALVAFMGDSKNAVQKSLSSEVPSSRHDLPISASKEKAAAAEPAGGHREENHALGWDVNVLRNVDGKRFEMLCVRYFELLGFTFKAMRRGSDGGIRVKLFKSDTSKPLAVIQCRSGSATSVGVDEVRELSNVMEQEKIARGVFIVAGGYTGDALAFGKTNSIQMLDAADFLFRIEKLPEEKQQKLLRYALKVVPTIPTCPNCGGKMEKRIGTRGSSWECLSYPACGQAIAAASAA